MPDEHVHNKDGAKYDYATTVGDELVTWAVIECTCGQSMSNKIVGRVNIAPRKSED